MSENGRTRTSVGSKRGRPKRDTLSNKIGEGEENEGNLKYKCPECNRLFPRSKSLKAHLRIHNGERPYLCDYPNCSRAFCQSGQLRTHQRTHTREEVFACPDPACKTRFIHTNRRCPLHPNLKLKRDGKAKVREDNPHLSCEEVIWLQRYKAEKENPAKRIRKDSVNTKSPGINSSSDINDSDTNILPDADMDSSGDWDLEELYIISNFIQAVKNPDSQKLQKEADKSLFGFISPGINNSSDTNSLPDADSSDIDSSGDLEELDIISNFIQAVKNTHSEKLQNEADESLFGFTSSDINSSLDTNNLPDADSSDTDSSDTNSLPDSNSSGDVEDDKTLKYLEARKNFQSEKSQRELEGAESLIQLHVKPIVFSQM